MISKKKVNERKIYHNPLSIKVKMLNHINLF
jgi:hypothetical protein